MWHYRIHVSCVILIYLLSNTAREVETAEHIVFVSKLVTCGLSLADAALILSGPCQE